MPHPIRGEEIFFFENSKIPRFLQCHFRISADNVSRYNKRDPECKIIRPFF